jgi:heat shock protein HslJ
VIKRNSLIYVLFFLIPLFNCFLTEQEEDEPEEKTLQNTLWILESFEIDGNVTKPKDEQIYNVQFKDDSTFTGINDCNVFGGEYEVKEGKSIMMLRVGGSKIYCSESLFLEYLEAFRIAKSYEIHKNRLYIYYGDNAKLIFCSE